MKQNHSSAILAQTRGLQASLTPSEAAVAKMIIDHPAEVVRLSVEALAQRAKVSTTIHQQDYRGKANLVLGGHMEALRLAIIADIHYGQDDPTKRGSAGLSLLEDTLEKIDEREVDLLVDLGDRINDESEENDLQRLKELGKCFRAASAPQVHLLGNHDIVHLSLEAAEAVLETPLRHRSLDLKGWHLVFWYADCSYEPRVGGLTISQADLDWLQADLEATALPSVIFSHVPLDEGSMVGNYYFEQEPFSRAGYKNAHVARAVLESSDKVVMALAGHVHWNALNTIDGIHYLTVQSLTETFTTHPHPAAAWAELQLGHTIELKVHGRDPIGFSLPVKMPDKHWLAYGGKRRPLPRDYLAKLLLESEVST